MCSEHLLKPPTTTPSILGLELRSSAETNDNGAKFAAASLDVELEITCGTPNDVNYSEPC